MKQTGYLKVFFDWQERFQKLSDAELGRLLRAAISYKRDGLVPQLTGREELLFDGLKLEIDRDIEAYDAMCRSRQSAGRAGAAARWQPDGKHGKCHFADGKHGKEEDKEKDKDKDFSFGAQARRDNLQSLIGTKDDRARSSRQRRNSFLDGCPNRPVSFDDMQGIVVDLTPSMPP